jgi:hypothetical protein
VADPYRYSNSVGAMTDSMGPSFKNGRSWTLIISEETGKLATIRAENRSGLIIFVGALTFRYENGY